jgi:hypothetical protein
VSLQTFKQHVFNKKRGRFGPRFFMFLESTLLAFGGPPDYIANHKKPNAIKGLTDVSGKN